MENTQKSGHNRKEEIIAAALKVFSEKGYLGSSNKDIAKAAGISSAALIYHYFENREDLLKQVIQRYHPALQFFGTIENLLDLELKDALERVAEIFPKILQVKQSLAVFKILLGESLRETSIADNIYTAVPEVILYKLEKLFEKHIQEGSLKNIPPGQMAINFLGPLAFYLLSNLIFDRKQEFFDYKLHVELFLNGVKEDKKL